MIKVYDRYSDDVFIVEDNTIFICGNKVWTIRKTNKNCVDLIENGKLINWYCLEYVVKRPELFYPIIICKHPKVEKLKIIQKPYLWKVN